MKKVGYARLSTLHKSFGDQIAELESFGCEKIFLERLPNKSTDVMEQLQLALDFVSSGDVLVVTKLDRLATSLIKLNVLVKQLQKKQVGLKVLRQKVDTTGNDGKLVSMLINAIAQFESALLNEQIKPTKKVYVSEHDPVLQKIAEKYALEFFANNSKYPSIESIAQYLLNKHSHLLWSNSSSKGLIKLSSIKRRFDKTW